MAAIISPEVPDNRSGLCGVPVVFTSSKYHHHHQVETLMTHHPLLEESLHPVSVAHGAGLQEMHQVRRSSGKPRRQAAVERCVSLHLDVWTWDLGLGTWDWLLLLI